MVAETLEEYALDSVEAAYANPGEETPMIFMELGGEIQVSENKLPWMDQKRYYFPCLTDADNSRWETVVVCISVAEESIIKETGRFNTDL